jgi:hypothetical protein
MLLEDVLTNYLPGHRGAEWSWEDEEQDILIRVCLCCGRRGHYQEQLEAFIEKQGLKGMGVCLGEDGFVWDGHHRIIAAKHLGISVVPLESRADADARWARDHGLDHGKSAYLGDAIAADVQIMKGGTS